MAGEELQVSMAATEVELRIASSRARNRSSCSEICLLELVSTIVKALLAARSSLPEPANASDLARYGESCQPGVRVHPPKPAALFVQPSDFALPSG